MPTDLPIGAAPAAEGATPIEDAVAARLSERRAAPPGPAEDVLHELGALDQAVYGAVADSPTPSLDRGLRAISHAANYSQLWLAIAALLAVAGGHRGRRAALRGVLAIGVSSAVVNQGVKRVARRGRPDRDGHDVPRQRHVRMPSSTSFPSGHSASAFAFATAAGHEFPYLAVPLNFLAGVVAYSRVHTGVHYPGDVVIGSLIGGASGTIVSAVERHRG